jgi:hypothetical protein
MVALEALNVMKEGHDGSGVGLYLTDLAGDFEPYKELPTLSGIFSNAGMKKLDDYMLARGFRPKFERTIRPSKPAPAGTPRRDVYLVSVYDYPDEWKYLPRAEVRFRLMLTRVTLRQMGLEDGSMMVFSFWPDTIMIKEIGDPMEIADYLDLGDRNILARSMLAQGRQNTNYAINLYACHPFFIQGVCTMTNGENTAFVPIREYLSSRGVTGYEGYQSDSEVFTHILHFTLKRLGLGIDAYKHVITPLTDAELEGHIDRAFLMNLKHICRKLIIDGPNCVIGCTPDGSMFMVQDRKKLRPGVVGGRPGIFAFSSEICGLNEAIPNRDRTKDFQPMYLDTAIVGPDCREVKICRQSQSLPLPH